MPGDATGLDAATESEVQAAPTDPDAESEPAAAAPAGRDGDEGADPPAQVTELATELGKALADLPEHEAYVAAERAVRESEEVQEAIAAFNEQRREFAHARQTGEATDEDLEALQAAQRELHAMPVMAEYLEAQERLQATLGAVEASLSDPLAVDFGETAGGCCQD